MADTKKIKSVPEHPLPEEIQRMQRDETVCKFCGVSYLIHNEIKNLEDKLKAAEQELSLLRGCEKREEQLKFELESVQHRLVELETKIADRDKSIAGLKAVIEENESVLREHRKNKEILEDDHQKLLTESNMVNEKCDRLIKALAAVRPELKKQKECFFSMRQEVTRFCSDILEKTSSVTEVMKLIKLQHNEDIKLLNDTKVSLEKDFESVNRKCHFLEADVTEKEQRIHTLLQKESENVTLTSALQSLESHCEVLESKCRTCEMELDTYRATNKEQSEELDGIREQLKSRESLFEEKMNRLQTELSKREGEMNMLRKKEAELQNKLQAQLQQNQDILSKMNTSHHCAEEASEQLKRAKGDVDAMRKEREMMITAHQNQIEQLRESFKNRIAEADKWPQKMEQCLAEERKKHALNMDMLEEKLKQNFVMELQIEKQKHQELLDKYSAETKESEVTIKNQMNAELSKSRNELAEVHKQLAASKARFRESENSMRQEIESLKGIIRELEGRLGKLDTASDQKVVELKSQINSLQTELAGTKEQCKHLETQHQSARDEVGFLQDTVRRECEERFELTEALSQAREELLALKKPLGGYVTNMRTASSVSSTSSRPTSAKSTQNKKEDAPLFKRTNTMIKPLPGPPTSPPVPCSTKSVQGSHDAGNNGELVNSSNLGFDGEKAAKPSKGLKGNSTMTESRKRIAYAVGRR